MVNTWGTDRIPLFTAIFQWLNIASFGVFWCFQEAKQRIHRSFPSFCMSFLGFSGAANLENARKQHVPIVSKLFLQENTPFSVSNALIFLVLTEPENYRIMEPILKFTGQKRKEKSGFYDRKTRENVSKMLRFRKLSEGFPRRWIPYFLLWNRSDI